MNLPEPQLFPPAAAPGLSAAQIQQARAEVASSGRNLLALLEERSGLPPEKFVAALAAVFHYPVASLAELQRWTPAFDVLPLAQAMQRDCLAFVDGEGALRLAVADPFDKDLLAWADASIDRAFAWVLVHRTELAAYLSQQEENLRAIDRKSTRLNSSHIQKSRMPSSA